MLVAIDSLIDHVSTARQFVALALTRVQADDAHVHAADHDGRARELHCSCHWSDAASDSARDAATA